MLPFTLICVSSPLYVAAVSADPYVNGDNAELKLQIAILFCCAVLFCSVVFVVVGVEI